MELSEFKKQSHIDDTLIDAVVDALYGWEEECAISSLKDINQHGIAGGYGAFIYYKDTVKFYQDYKSQINDLLKETAESLGTSVIEMVRNFNCLGKDDYSEDEVGRVLYSNDDPSQLSWGAQIANALAWYAGEEVARSFCELED